MPTQEAVGDVGDDDSDDSSRDEANKETAEATTTAAAATPASGETKDVEMKDVGDQDDDDDDDDEEEFKDADTDAKKAESKNKSDNAVVDDKNKDDNKKDDEDKKDPFAEEDSDNDDENNKDKKKPETLPEKSAAAASADKKGGDDDDSDDEEVGKKKDEGGKTPEKKGKKDDDDDDDLLEDSDEGDVEFDDSGVVTGASHNKNFQRKVSQKSTVDKIREAEEEAFEKEGAEIDRTPPKPRPPKVDPRTMVVMEPELPPSSATLHITKLPQLVGVQPEAFDPATYSAAAEEEDYQGFPDMIRWRYQRDSEGNMLRGDDGKLLRESNARLVQWEDGSYTIHVGKETFGVDNVDSTQSVPAPDGKKATFAGLNGYLYLSQIATFREQPEEKKGDDEDGDDNSSKNKEPRETPAGTVLECMGAVGSRMTARPSSLHSDAHKSHTVAVRQKTIKKARIAEIVTQFDPEKAKMERIKVKDGLEKEKERKRYGDRDRSYNRAPRSRPGMNRSYLEDGDYDDTNLRSMKKRTMNADDEDMDDYGDDYGYDDDDDDGATFNQKRPKKRTGVTNKNRLDDSDEDDGGNAVAKGGVDDDDDDDDDNDDDDDFVAPVKSSKKRSHQAVVDDDDDSD